MALADTMLPREVCERLNDNLGIESVYAVGLGLDKEIMGGVFLLLPRGESLQGGKVVETIARHLAVLLNRLCAEMRLRQSEYRFRELVRRSLHLREEQNAAISRELHDDLGQSLTALAMDLTLVERDLRGERGLPDVLATADTLRDMHSLLNETASKIRNISQLLRPAILDSAEALEALEWQVQEFTKRSGIVTAFHCNLDFIDLTKEQALAVFRTVQEALTNCARHSSATRVNVSVRRRGQTLHIAVRDNGVGFSPTLRYSGACLGILGMEEHMSSCGGSVMIDSNEGKGTTVRVRLPLKEAT
jgi:signal transduction histidine kinase